MIFEKIDFLIPDFLLKDDKGQFSELPLRHWLRINTSHSKLIKSKVLKLVKDSGKDLEKHLSKDKKFGLLYIYNDLLFRQRLFNRQIKKLREALDNKKHFNERDKMLTPLSFDYLTLSMYEKGFYETKTSDEVIDGFFSEIDFDENSEIGKLLEEEVEELRTSDYSLHLWPKLLADLNHFDDLEQCQKELVMVVASCFHTLYFFFKVGPYFIDKYPFLKEYFTLALEEGESEEETVDKANSSKGDENKPENWQDFFESLKTFAETTLKAGITEQTTEQWQTFVEQSSALPEWVQAQAIDVKGVIEHFVDKTITPILLQFEDKDDVHLFGRTLPPVWCKELLEQVYEEESFTTLTKLLDDKLQQATELASELKDIKFEILTFEADNSGTLNSFKVRKALNKLKAKNEELVFEILETLTPEGYTLDDIAEHPHINLDDYLPDSYFNNFQSVLTTLIDKCVAFEKVLFESKKPLVDEAVVSATQSIPIEKEEDEDREDEEEVVVPETEPVAKIPADNEPEVIAPEIDEIPEPETAISEEQISESEDETITVIDEEEALEGEVLFKNEVIDITTSNEQVVDRIRNAIQSESSLSGLLIDNAALNLILKKDISSAYHIINTIDNSIYADEHYLSERLIKVAYFAENVWNANDQIFKYVRSMLYGLQPSDLIEENLKGIERILPFLGFKATFQPSLFGGYRSNAVVLLKHIKDMFDVDEVKLLIEEVIELADHNSKVSLHILRDQEQSNTESTNLIVDEVKQWKELTVDSNKGFTPNRRFLRYLIESGEYKQAYDVVVNNLTKDAKLIEDFVEKFSEPDQFVRVFNQTDKHFEDLYIQKNRKYAISLFTKQSMEFIQIAHRWLDSIETENPNQTENTKKFTARFIKNLHKTHEVIENKIKDLDDSCMARKVGYELIQRNIYNLIEAIDHNKDQSIWSEQFVEVSFNRALKLADPKQEKESGELILSLAKNLLEENIPQRVFEESLNAGLYDLAHVSLNKMKLMGQNTEQLLDKYLKQRNKAVDDIASLIHEVENLTDNAILSEILDENEAYNDRDILINYRDEVVEGKLDYLLDLRTIKTELQKRKQELESKFDESKDRLIKRFEDKIETARTKDLVENSFIKLVNQAEKESNLTVLEEFIEELENSVVQNKPIEIDREPSLFPVSHFEEMSDELYKFVSQSNNTSSIKSHIKDKFGRTRPVTDDEANAIKWMMNSTKLSQKMNQNLYFEHVRLLKVLGFSIKHEVYSDQVGKTTDYRTSASFSQMEFRMKRPNDFVKCFPFIRTDFGETKVVLTITTPWQSDTLKEYLDNNVIHASILFVISLYPLDKKERKAFANYCKTNSRTILLIDQVFLLYLIANQEKYSAFQPIRTYLHLASAYTYYNPYTGDRLDPPPEEMRFGRKNEIRSLMDYSNGAAIIFGGRQLGKSTILQGVENNFRNLERHQHVLAYKVDGSVISEDNWLKFGMRREWNTIYEFFVQNKLIDSSQVEPKDIHELKGKIKSCFNKDKDLRVIVIIDEVDTLLNIDSAMEFPFPFIRDLRELVTATNYRFKVIICGLQNVKRFDTSPNNPLKGLGKSLAVGIMSTSDALNLIKTPLEALGYKFESPLVANRILALTNRHPGLLQVFCYHLVNYLKSKHTQAFPIGQYQITNNDVTQVYNRKDVEDVIKNRFAITLHLDVRYAIIIYSLVLKGYGLQKFSVRVAQETAGEWLEPLKNMSQKQFNAILDELVGLGVLRKDKEHYAIRNTSVLKLLGNTKEVEDSILSEIDHYETTDPLEYHRVNNNGNGKERIPSPLTRRDEELIIGVNHDEDKKFNELDSITDYLKTSTVSVVSGSNALGLFALEKSLSGLYNRDNPSGANSSINQYEVTFFDTAKYSKFKVFQTQIDRLKQKAAHMPTILLVDCDGSKPAEEVDNYIDYALAQTKELEQLKHPSRIIFSFQPLAAWNWLNYPVGEGKQEEMTFIRLAKWNQSALKAHLSYFELNDRIEKSKEFLEFSQGWYQPPYYIGMKQHKYKGDDYKKICKNENISAYNEKNARKFISFTGIEALPWVKPLLSELVSFSEDELDKSTIETVISYLSEDYDIQAEDTGKVITWLTRLCILSSQVKRNDGRSENYYAIDQYVKQYLNT